MFENAGAKLKEMAKIIFVIHVISAMAGGAIIIVSSGMDLDWAITVLTLMTAAGIVIGWCNTIMLYSFGELCENVHSINKKLQVNNMRQGNYGGIPQPQQNVQPYPQQQRQAYPPNNNSYNPGMRR